MVLRWLTVGFPGYEEGWEGVEGGVQSALEVRSRRVLRDVFLVKVGKEGEYFHVWH